MFAEGESELRDLVAQNLESCGFLNKIKAEIRAGVILALSEDGNIRKKVQLFNKKLDDFMNTSDGKLALSVVREFLEYFNLNFTLSVFEPEVSSSSSFANRKQLCEDLKLNESELEGKSILSALLKKENTTKLSELTVDTPKNDIREKAFKDTADNALSGKNKDRSNVNTYQRNTEEDKTKNAFYESNKLNENSKSSTNRRGNDKNFFDFGKPEEKDIFKDQSISSFFDDPLPSEKPNFLSLSSNTGILSEQKSTSSPFLGNTVLPNDEKKSSSTFLQFEKESALNDQKKLTILPSEKGSLSSLRDLPSLTKQSNKQKEPLSITLGSEVTSSDNMDRFKEDAAKKDATESNDEYSDRQINSEDSIEEEIEEEFSAGLDDLLNSSLSLGDDATSDQTISQASVVDGVDHMESCNNTVN